MKNSSLMKLARLSGFFFTLLIYTTQGSDFEDKIRHLETQVDNEAVEVYVGKVGKLEAYFFIEWGYADHSIQGFYYYPSRGQAKRYRLKGTNPSEGVLTLQEFTPQGDGTYEHSASCRLTKKVTPDRVIWEGQMNNTDGRVLPIEFARTR